jgi:hypothetical protein
MAKPKKDDPSRSLADRSVLKFAFDAFQKGDAVETRRLARAVLAGQVGPHDAQVAASLAQTLSVEGAQVSETPAAVAHELIDRTIVGPKPYLFVGVVVAAFATLVFIASHRYGLVNQAPSTPRPPAIETGGTP